MTSPARKIERVAVVGAGLIGMSWTSLFLSKNLDVIVIDPRSEAESETRDFVARAWPHLRALEPAANDAPRSFAFAAGPDALHGVDFVQENGPDRLETKQALIHRIEDVVSPDVIIASSTSSLLASDIQTGARAPERILVAHPMNPPHLVPMVELVAGRATRPQAVDQAEEFYRGLGRVVIRVRKELVGHLANRLTSALYREAVYLVAEGVASVEDVDKAIAYGPGLRWALMGPHLTYHLGGGKGGYRHYLDHLGPTQEARWREHGTPQLTEELKERLVAGVEEELRAQDRDTLVERRDEALVELLALKRRRGF